MEGECDKIRRRKFGVIERNDFDHTVYLGNKHITFVRMLRSKHAE